MSADDSEEVCSDHSIRVFVMYAIIMWSLVTGSGAEVDVRADQ